jgi:hypothetical protein
MLWSFPLMCRSVAWDFPLIWSDCLILRSTSTPGAHTEPLNWTATDTKAHINKLCCQLNCVFSLYIFKYSLHHRDKCFKRNIRYSQTYNFSSAILQNVAVTVKWTALLQRTREVPGLNLVPDTGYPQNFSWFSWPSSGQYLQLGQFGIHWSPDHTTLQTYNMDNRWPFFEKGILCKYTNSDKVRFEHRVKERRWWTDRGRDEFHSTIFSKGGSRVYLKRKQKLKNGHTDWISNGPNWTKASQQLNMRKKAHNYDFWEPMRTARLDVATTLTRIREMLGSKLARDIGCHDWGFSMFSSVLPSKWRAGTSTGPRPCPSKYFTIHHSIVILLLDIILSNTLIVGHAVALCYKPEGRGIEYRWGGFFQFT